ncbi:MAG: LacI family DNA-binding transcriptional regulator [Actinomycetota bacterium]
MYRAAERRGYHVVLGAMTAGRDERQAVEEPLSFRSEAIILIAPTSGRQQLARLGQQIPLIETGRRLTGDGGVGVDVVRVADERGAQQAVDHLVALGHRDIVHRHHLQDHIRILPGDYTEESGAQAAGTLLQADKPPSAIFAANDRCAHGVIATLSRAGLDIPNDVSVVGYDDSRIARLSFVDLTTIRQDATQMAELAVEAAAQRLDEGRTTARDIVVKPTLIVRGSTGPARP